MNAGPSGVGTDGLNLRRFVVNKRVIDDDPESESGLLCVITMIFVLVAVIFGGSILGAVLQ